MDTVTNCPNHPLFCHHYHQHTVNDSLAKSNYFSLFVFLSLIEFLNKISSKLHQINLPFTVHIKTIQFVY